MKELGGNCTMLLRYIYIENISVISCGKQTSVSYPAYGLKTCLSAFFIFDINVFQMINVLVQDSLGRAISAFNCNSIVLQNISFKMNGRNMTSTSETNYDSIYFNQSFHSIPSGGAIAVSNSSEITIHDVKFLNNGAVFGGAIYTEESHIILEGDVIFSNNSAECRGGAIMSFNSYISMEGNVSFFNNKAQTGGAILLARIIITFHGMLPVSFPSHINMKRNSIVNFHNNSAALHGGAICAFIAEYISMEGKVSFLNNKAGLNGGAIFANEMYILMEGNVIFIDNEAENGGAVFLFYSTCCLRSDLNFTGNHAHSQGGVIAVQGSNIKVEGTSYIYILNNSAPLGGAVYLEYNSRLTIDRTAKFIAQHNKAMRGGVIYVRDSTYAITCIALTDISFCPLQFHILTLSDLSNILSNILENFANESGNVIFGGFPPTCHNGEFRQRLSGLISSEPSRVTICGNEHSSRISVIRGVMFGIPVEVFNQIGIRVPATIRAVFLNSSKEHDSHVADDQIDQEIKAGCTMLNYTVFSTNRIVDITIYATDGLCGPTGDSVQRITIELQDCPPVFTKEKARCVCEKRLQQFTNTCDVEHLTFNRSLNFWVGIDRLRNGTYLGLILQRHCPLDYCKSDDHEVRVCIQDLDSQCQSNRAGILCGACKLNFSLTLGGSQCLQCADVNLALIIVFAVAGIILVFIVSVLNLTVSMGMLSGLLFYANIVAVNRTVFIPQDTTKVMTAFIAWLNLDFGIVSCFYDGMDAYTLTWLQYVFPVYNNSVPLVLCKDSTYNYYITFSHHTGVPKQPHKSSVAL